MIPEYEPQVDVSLARPADNRYHDLSTEYPSPRRDEVYEQSHTRSRLSRTAMGTNLFVASLLQALLGRDQVIVQEGAILDCTKYLHKPTIANAAIANVCYVATTKTMALFDTWLGVKPLAMHRTRRPKGWKSTTLSTGFRPCTRWMPTVLHR